VEFQCIVQCIIPSSLLSVECLFQQWEQTVCCNVLQCVAVCCMCCSVLQCVAMYHSELTSFRWMFVPTVGTNIQRKDVSAQWYIAMCCSVLQCVAVCCSVLQCVAMYHSALTSFRWMFVPTIYMPALSMTALGVCRVSEFLMYCAALFPIFVVYVFWHPTWQRCWWLLYRHLGCRNNSYLLTHSIPNM